MQIAVYSQEQENLIRLSQKASKRTCIAPQKKNISLRTDETKINLLMEKEKQGEKNLWSEAHQHVCHTWILI